MSNPFLVIPSLDVMLKSAVLLGDIDRRGRRSVANALRNVIADLRACPGALPETSEAAMALIAVRTKIHLDQQGQSPVRAVFNLTGTILHTNLGRAVLPDSAIAAVTLAAGSASSLEFDLDTGRRGDRERGLVEQFPLTTTLL